MSHPNAPAGARTGARPDAAPAARPARTPLRTAATLLAAGALLATLTGCSVLAAPCRISAAVVKTVPVAGKVAAVPLDACADIID